MLQEDFRRVKEDAMRHPWRNTIILLLLAGIIYWLGVQFIVSLGIIGVIYYVGKNAKW